MKVIDLLNKIANGEEVPEKITYKDNTYHAEYNNGSGKYYYADDEDNLLLENIDSVYQLDEEIEVKKIEDKKIENIKDLNTDFYDKNETYDCLGNKEIVLDILTLKHKINEIIDYINREIK